MKTLLTENFKIDTEYEAGQSYMVLEILNLEKVEIYNYQVEMIANNPRTTIIPFEVRRKNENIKLYYNVTSMAALKDFLKCKKFSKYAFADILSQVTGTIIESGNLFLYEKNFIINENTVYIDPEKDVISIIYLPVKMEPNHYQDLKDFIINLITKTAVIEMQSGDNYLQRIIEFVKAPEFNLSNLNKLLNSIKNECMTSISYPPQEPIFNKQLEIALQGDRKTAKKQDFKESTLKNKKAKYNYKTLLTVTISQLIIVALALIIESLLVKQAIEIETRYILEGMFVLIADLLVYKYLILRKIIINKNEVKKKVQDKVQTKYNNLLSMSKKEFTNVDLNIPSEIKHNTQEPETLWTCKSIESPKGNDETTILYDGGKIGAQLIFEEAGIVKKYEIRKERFLIGRNCELSDLIIDEKSVGRVHAEIITKGDEYFIIDKNSKNGTFINNERLTNGQEYRLISNSSIVFANKEYKFLMG